MRITAAIATAVAAAGTPLTAQVVGVDSTRVHDLGALVVTADRMAGAIEWSTAPVSIIRGDELRALGPGGLARALREVPGFAFLDFDGLGYAPQATARGFYGGGEAEYVLVLLDGRPLNELETGLIRWDQVPLADVEAVEVVRGPASSLYGDAALAAVVNIVTRRTGAAAAEPFRLTAGSFSTGSFGRYAGELSARGRVGSRTLGVSANLDRTSGFRDHAGRTVGGFMADLGLVEEATRSLTLSAVSHWRTVEDPGAVPQSGLAQHREAASPFYRFDRAADQRHRASLRLDEALGSDRVLSVDAGIEFRDLDQTRTLPLSPEFADTKDRRLSSLRTQGGVQLMVPALWFVDDQLVLGVDGSIGTADTEYFGVLSGDADTYAGASGGRGDLDARGDARRSMLSGFLQYNLRPTDRIKVSVGGRYDRVGDRYRSERPEPEDETSTSHEAFSPKAGINVELFESGSSATHWFANVARAFKAPTLDQLYDRRSTPIPFPPFSITTSNEDLVPQEGTSFETGLYQRAELGSGAVVGELSISAYRMDMRDEIDFDVSTFRYSNIGRSRHDGVEAGLKLWLRGGTMATVAYTRQSVTARSGDHAGNALKAVPGDYFSLALRSAVGGAGEVGVTLVSAQRMFLDDANTRTIPNYTVAGIEGSYGIGAVRIFGEVENLFDELYNSTGFPDPAGSDIVFVNPAAGRSLSLGVRFAPGANP